MEKIYVCKFCEESSLVVDFRRPGNMCRVCEKLHGQIKKSNYPDNSLSRALDKVFSNRRLQDIVDMVKEFNRDTRLHINHITMLSKLLTPEERKLVVELLKYEKQVYLDTVNEYE